VPYPTPQQLNTLISKIIKTISRLLVGLGHLIKEDGITYLARTDNNDADNILTPLQAASTTYRIAAGPRAGRNVQTIVGGAVGCGERSEPHQSRDLCANDQGFSLHAGVHLDANDRQGPSTGSGQA
jgi:hypothetical protein